MVIFVRLGIKIGRQISGNMVYPESQPIYLLFKRDLKLRMKHTLKHTEFELLAHEKNKDTKMFENNTE